MVPDCDEVAKAGRSCQHSSTETPPCADSAVILRKDEGVEAAIDLRLGGVIQSC